MDTRTSTGPCPEIADELTSGLGGFDCSWYDSAGQYELLWLVANVALTLRPDMTFGTSPTEPVHAGPMYKKLDRLFFTLTTERPTDVW